MPPGVTGGVTDNCEKKLPTLLDGDAQPGAGCSIIVGAVMLGVAAGLTTGGVLVSRSSNSVPAILLSIEFGDSCEPTDVSTTRVIARTFLSVLPAASS